MRETSKLWDNDLPGGMGGGSMRGDGGDNMRGAVAACILLKR